MIQDGGCFLSRFPKAPKLQYARSLCRIRLVQPRGQGVVEHHQGKCARCQGRRIHSHLAASTQPISCPPGTTCAPIILPFCTDDSFCAQHGPEYRIENLFWSWVIPAPCLDRPNATSIIQAPSHHRTRSCRTILVHLLQTAAFRIRHQRVLWHWRIQHCGLKFCRMVVCRATCQASTTT